MITGKVSQKKDLKTRPKPHILDSSFSELEESYKAFSKEKYRLAQVADWIFSRKARSFSDMSNLPVELRDRLSRSFVLRALKISRKETSRLDGTIKLTFESDGSSMSCVFLPGEGYNTLCISTQVGCAFACSFCASGLIPFERNLTCGEILDQLFITENETGQNIHNVLYMGMGEPLANYDNTLKSLQWLVSPYGFKMSPSRITVSTSGLEPGILKLAERRLKVNLALSLHAPDDELRKKIMPVSAGYSIKKVLQACKIFQNMNGSDFTVEYILIKGVNDGEKNALELVKTLRTCRFPVLPKINLIPFNAVRSIPFEAPGEGIVRSFYKYLKSRGFVVHTRKPRGTDIHGACGQLL